MHTLISSCQKVIFISCFQAVFAYCRFEDGQTQGQPLQPNCIAAQPMAEGQSMVAAQPMVSAQPMVAAQPMVTGSGVTAGQQMVEAQPMVVCQPLIAGQPVVAGQQMASARPMATIPVSKQESQSVINHRAFPAGSPSRDNFFLL